MALIGNIAIGMSVGTAAMTKGLKSARTAVKSFGDSIMSIQGLAVGVLGGGAAVAINKMAGNFAHLAEASNKVDAVFGKQADNVKANARAMADAYGLSFSEILDQQSMLGASLTGVGFSEKAAANYADVFTRLATDAARRWDIDGGTSEALEKIMAALRGSSDALEKYGVTFNEETVKAKAYAMGLAKVGQELSEGAKKQARAAIVLEQMKSSIGSASAEAGSFSGNVEALSGRWENLTTTLGEVFAPTLGTIMGDLGVLLKIGEDGWTANREGVGAFASEGLGGLQNVAMGVGVVQGAVMKLVDTWQILKLSFSTVQTYINSGLISIIKYMAEFKRIVDDMSGKSDPVFGGGAIGLLTGGQDGGNFFDDWAGELEKKNGTLIEDLKAQWDKPWASEGFSAMWTQAVGKIKTAQDKLAASPMTLDKNTGASGTATKLVKDAKPYGSAVLAGSAEAAKSIARARLGGGNTVENNTRMTFKEVTALRKELMKTPSKIGEFLDKRNVAKVSM